MGTNCAKRWVLVTGGSRGIGSGIVEALAQEGYGVVYTSRSADVPGDETSNAKGRIRCKKVDGTNSDAVAAFAKDMLDELGAPYAIINNAGITSDGALLTNSLDSWTSVIDSNLNSVFYVTKAFLPSMVEARSGSIIQISSVTAIKGNSGQTNYAASKSAMLGFTRSLAHEVARFGVRVNAILPGLIDTDMVRKLPEPALKSLRSMIPMRRVGNVREIADCVSFLISDRASYITGQSIVIDGGLTA